jgi:hypothetical protein
MILFHILNNFQSNKIQFLHLFKLIINIADIMLDDIHLSRSFKVLDNLFLDNVI